MTRPAPPRCREHHDHGPDDPVEWNGWALDRQVTHYVERCPGCGRYALWYRRARPVPTEED